MHHVLSSSFLKRSAVATAVVALGFASFAPAQASTTGKVTINTVKSWDRGSSIGSFGRPDTSTYGQVITVPAGKTTLNRFVFYMNDAGASGTMVVRGEVYAWDGTKATGSALYETAPSSLSYGDTAFHAVKFLTGGVAVTAGSQYVVFASVAKDYESCTDGYTNNWGSMADTVYTGGDFVYQNNAGDESQWTTVSWSTFGLDLAFRANLS